MAATCHDLPAVASGATGRKVVLAGNPNVGKSAVFFALTGVYTNVSNFPGTTVDIASGRLGGDILLDTPGAYGLSPFSEDERVARDCVLAGDLVVNVVDATNLARDLFLTLQLVDLGLPVVVALNMMDQARRLGLTIDRERPGGRRPQPAAAGPLHRPADRPAALAAAPARQPAAQDRAALLGLPGRGGADLRPRRRSRRMGPGTRTRLL